MFDEVFKKQLCSYFKNLEAQYALEVRVAATHPKRDELLETLEGLAACSDRITVNCREGNNLSFSIYKNGIDTRIKFRSVVGGHEFSSLILAILNCDGKGSALPNEQIIDRLGRLNGPIHLITYVNQTCLICSELVQRLNALTINSDRMYHEVVDGSINKMEVIEKRVMNLPTVFADNDQIMLGRADYHVIMNKLEAKYGVN